MEQTDTRSKASAEESERLDITATAVLVLGLVLPSQPTAPRNKDNGSLASDVPGSQSLPSMRPNSARMLGLLSIHLWSSKKECPPSGSSAT